MNDVEFKGGPLLAGWVVAAGVGLVAFGVSAVVMELDWNAGVAIGAVLFTVVGLILGLPRGTSMPAEAPAILAPTDFEAPAPLMAAPHRTADPVSLAAMRPAGLAAARDSGADDLKQIKGVGPVLEKLLHSLGYFHFDQIAAWTAAEVSWVDENLEGFKGRVTRDEWVPQARILAAGGTTEFSRRVEDGEVY